MTQRTQRYAFVDQVDSDDEIAIDPQNILNALRGRGFELDDLEDPDDEQDEQAEQEDEHFCEICGNAYDDHSRSGACPRF